jgi:pilus assembly protein CpaC
MMKTRKLLSYILIISIIVPQWSGFVPLRAEDEPFKKSRLTSDKSEGTSDKRTLILTTGEDKVVDLNFDANVSANGVSIGNPKIVAVNIVRVGEEQQVVFKPLAAGTTTVSVRDTDGTVRLIFTVQVNPTDLLKVASELRELLRDIDGIEISIRGSRIFIDGEILVPNDYGRLYNVLENKNSPYAGLVVNLVTLSPVALTLLTKRIQEEVQKFAQNVTARVVNGQVWLEGSVQELGEARRAKNVAELYLPPIRPLTDLERAEAQKEAASLKRGVVVQNFIAVAPPPPKKAEKLIRVTVHFVELSKDYKKVFGFKWEPGFTSEPSITVGTTVGGTTGATTSNGTGGTSFTATISSLIPKLQSAQDAGFARILKTGSVIVRSGQPAKLEDTEQEPFGITAPNGQVTTGIAGTGLAVAITPLILGDSEDISVDLEMSQKNKTGKTDSGAPITAEHKVNTKLYIRSKESAAVAGVNKQSVSNDFNKDDPRKGSFGGKTEPLFSLLRSKAYNKKKSEFVIFVTPEIIENASQGTDDLRRNFRVRSR